MDPWAGWREVSCSGQMQMCSGTAGAECGEGLAMRLRSREQDGSWGFWLSGDVYGGAAV